MSTITVSSPKKSLPTLRGNGLSFLSYVLMSLPKDQCRHKSERSHHQDQACRLWRNRYRRWSSTTDDRRRPRRIYRRIHRISRPPLWGDIRRRIVRDKTRLTRSAEHTRHRGE